MIETLLAAPDIILGIGAVIVAFSLFIRAIATGVNRYSKARENAALWKVEAERGKAEIERLRIEAQQQDQERNDRIIASMIQSQQSLVEGLQDVRKAVDNSSSVTTTLERTITAMIEQGHAHTRELQAMRQDLNAWPAAVQSSLEVHDNRVTELNKHVIELTSIMRDYISEADRQRLHLDTQIDALTANIQTITDYLNKERPAA